MHLESHIKSMSGLTLIWAKLTRAKGFLLLNKVYFLPDIYQNLISNYPDPINVGYLIHENTHYQRCQKMGTIKFGFRYLSSRRNRLEEELLAYGKQMKYLKSKGLEFDTDRIAKALASWVYWWCTSYTYAKTNLDKIWSEN